jgi:hypothetical protein
LSESEIEMLYLMLGQAGWKDPGSSGDNMKAHEGFSSPRQSTEREPEVEGTRQIHVIELGKTNPGRI